MLVDVATKVLNGEAVDVTMGSFNLIWQGDACARAIQCWQHVASPPKFLNITGAEKVSIRHVAEEFGRLLGKEPFIKGEEAESAWLADASESMRLFGPVTTSLETIMKMVADHLQGGGKLLGKPTHFESRDGKF